MSLDVGQVFLQLFQGFLTSINIFAFTLIFALPLGLILSFGEMSKFKPLSYLIKGFIWIIRGTPLILQIIVIFYVPALLGFDLEILFSWMFEGAANSDEKVRTVFVIIAFIINYSCYFSEIYRGGIQSISRGQVEACRVLGIKRGTAFKRVIFPQVYKRILPPMSNEIITLVKDTSLARAIGVMEIIMVAENLTSLYGVVWPLLATGVFYLIFNGFLTLLFSFLEKKVGYYK